jgi:hypothetical protein
MLGFAMKQVQRGTVQVETRETVTTLGWVQQSLLDCSVQMLSLGVTLGSDQPSTLGRTSAGTDVYRCKNRNIQKQGVVLQWIHFSSKHLIFSGDRDVFLQLCFGKKLEEEIWYYR